MRRFPTMTTAQLRLTKKRKQPPQQDEQLHKAIQVLKTRLASRWSFVRWSMVVDLDRASSGARFSFWQPFLDCQKCIPATGQRLTTKDRRLPSCYPEVDLP